MDLPPSGWYPDPYGTPRLLRWWDGSTWTHHTHPDVTPGNGAASKGGEAVQATAVQAAVAQSAGVHATAVQSAVASTAVQAAVHATTVQPSTDWLRATKPPSGRPTAPQPALPATPYHMAVQPTAVQPGYPQPALGAMGGQAGGDGAGTHMMFMGGDPWQVPGGPAGPGGPGVGRPLPGGPGQGNYGYLQAQQRRRWMVIGGIHPRGRAVAVPR